MKKKKRVFAILLAFCVAFTMMPLAGSGGVAHAEDGIAANAVVTRTAMLDAINQEYIKTARAKGLKNSKIIFKHALRNALIPVITYLGPQIAFTLCGGLVVETVFSIPGLGRYFVQSIQNRDYPVIMGTTIFLATFIILMNLVVDILYKVADPRISLTKGGD